MPADAPLQFTDAAPNVPTYFESTLLAGACAATTPPAATVASTATSLLTGSLRL